jgi:hypothetical protein
MSALVVGCGGSPQLRRSNGKAHALDPSALLKTHVPAEHALSRHPSGPSFHPKLETFAAVELASGARLQLRYRLRGDLADVALAAHAPSRRVDRLWEHTCFEAFVAPEGREQYVEINVAPSTDWAAYVFDRYRHGMRPLDLARPPTIAVTRQPDELRVTADVDLTALTDSPWPWRVGLCAVVAETGGARSYWALRHPGPTPDFHDAAGFAVLLKGNTR